MMACADLKITLRDGTVQNFSEPVGENNEVNYEQMDKALHRLQEQSNTFLTTHVEKEKELNLGLTGQKNGQAVNDDNDDDEESSEDDEDDELGKPPEKKQKT